MKTIERYLDVRAVLSVALAFLLVVTLTPSTYAIGQVRHSASSSDGGQVVSDASAGEQAGSGTDDSLEEDGSSGVEGEGSFSDDSIDGGSSDDAATAPSGTDNVVEDNTASGSSSVGGGDAGQSQDGVASDGESAEDAAESERSSGQVANSWRYQDGEQVFSAQGARTNGEISLFGITTNQDGYKVFDSFDLFDRGYCTGEGAYKGIDVSYAQGVIDWAQVKASGVDYAIIRCGYGDDLRYQDDTYWLRNVSECIKHGIPFGVYIYSYATNVTMANSEVDHVLRCLSEAGLSAGDVELPIYFDMEDRSTIGSDYASLASTFCSRVQAAGYTPGVYANSDWWLNKLTAPCFNNWEKWVAEWNASVGLTCSRFSDFTTNGAMWQFSDYGKVAGINGRVDLNYTYRSIGSAQPGGQTVADGVYELVSGASSAMRLDVNGGMLDDGANVQIWSSNGSKAQRWRFAYDGQGYYTITGYDSGKALDVVGAGTASGTNVQQYASNETDAQKWRVDGNGDGTYTLINKGSGKALEVVGGATWDGANVQIYKSNGTAAQRWTLKSIGAAPGSQTIADGDYQISASYNPSLVFDVEGAADWNGANVQLWTENNTKAQGWRIAYDGAGYYTVTSLSSGKVLEAAGGCSSDGTNVHQYDLNETDAQKWRIDDAPNGGYSFVNKGSGTSLDIEGAADWNGANVQIYTQNGSDAQRFLLTKYVEGGSQILPDGEYEMVSALDDNYLVEVVGAAEWDYANVQLWTSNDTLAQRWKITYDDEGFYSLVCVNSGKALEATGVDPSGEKNVWQCEPNGSDAQKWRIDANEDGTFILVNKLSAMALDVEGAEIAEGANVQVHPLNGTAAQRFKFEWHPVDDRAVLPDGEYELFSRLGGDLVLEVEGAADWDYANVQLWTKNDTSAQRWRFVYDGNGHYLIVSLASGKVLDAEAGELLAGANVCQRASNGDDSQKWRVSVNSDGSITLFNKMLNGVLDVEGAGAWEGSNVQVYSSNDTSAQRWDVKYVSA